MTMKYLYIIGFCAFLSSCLTKENGSTSKEEKKIDPAMVTLTSAQIKNAAVELGTPAMKLISRKIRVSGVVDIPPQDAVSVSFPMGGFFRSTSLLPGMPVRKGQSLAVIEDPSFIQLQQDYLIAKEKLSTLSVEYERQRKLNLTKTSSDKTFEQTRSEYAVQQIQVKALAEKLSMLGINPRGLRVSHISRFVTVYSPVDGFVSKINVNTGKYVNPSDVVFELVNTNDLHLALTVFEKDLQDIRPGQDVRAHLTSDTTRTYRAEVILVGKDLDKDRSTTVHCHFKGTEKGLLPGMFLSAEVEVGRKQALTVPEEAVVRYGENEYVFVAETRSEFRLIKIERGNAEYGFVEVRASESPLNGKMIVTKNAYPILMKMKNTAEDD